MDFIPTLQYFAANLERLLPHGASTAEITVPGILTTLLLVRLDKQEGRSWITMSETVRRIDDLSQMDVIEIEALGKNHPGDHPSPKTVTFVCSNTDGSFMATPVMSFEHRNRKETDIFDYDDEGHITDMNEPRKERLFQATAKQLEKFREMGFFAPEAATISRPDLKLEETEIRISVTVEYKLSLEYLEFSHQSYQRRLTFLVNAIDDSIANDR